ncbi:MAG: hypothetical protein AB1Z23_13210 [Eubacteriales bacterium]
MIELLCKNYSLQSVPADVINFLIDGLEIKEDKSIMNLLLLLIKKDEIKTKNFKKIFEILIQLNNYDEIEPIINDMISDLNLEAAIADTIMKHLVSVTNNKASNRRYFELLLNMYEKSKSNIISRIKQISLHDFRQIFIGNDIRLIPIICEYMDFENGYNHSTRQDYAKKNIRIAKVNKNRQIISENIYKKIVIPHSDYAPAKHSDRMTSSDCREHEDEHHIGMHKDVGVGINKKLLDF